MGFITKSTKEGRQAAFNLASMSNPLNMGGPLKGTQQVLALADWIGTNGDKLEVVQLMGMLPFKALNFRYLVNHVKELYAELTGATKTEAVEPPKTEEAEPAQAENPAPDTGTVRRPRKQPRKKSS